MLQSYSNDGVRIYQDPGVRLVVDGQVRGAGELGSLWSSVKDWASDVVEAAQNLPGTLYHSPEMLYDTAKVVAKEGCQRLLSDDVREVATYCAAAVLVPGPQQPSVIAGCSAYGAAALACGMAFPQMPPVPQGTANTGGTSTGMTTQQTQAAMLLKQNAALQRASQLMNLTAQVTAQATPWYKKASTYAVAGGIAAAIGGAYYFTRVRR
jgi:hypothetical protein